MRCEWCRVREPGKMPLSAISSLTHGQFQQAALERSMNTRFRSTLRRYSVPEFYLWIVIFILMNSVKRKGKVIAMTY